jgi:CRP/FNR family cyclic AMP-dependent transcriptional regulator
MINELEIFEDRFKDVLAPLSSNSSFTDVRTLFDPLHSKYVERGSMLYGEGQNPRGVYILQEGRVKLSLESAHGKTLLLQIAGAGDMLGMNAAITGQPYEATAETLERCRIGFISRADLLKALARDRTGYEEIAESLSRKLSAVVEHTRMLFLSQSATEKVVRLLIQWCNEFGIDTDEGISISPRLTHEEMAQMICVSRETVTRVLGSLKRKQLIKLRGKVIVIPNREALQKIGGVIRCE